MNLLAYLRSDFNSDNISKINTNVIKSTNQDSCSARNCELKSISW